MNSSSIKYRYALSENGTIIDVKNLFDEDRKDYECLGCGNVLRPVLGKIRNKHFRHKIDQNCSLETYLHRIGKKLFIDTYNKCLQKKLEYIIEYEVPTFCDFCEHGPCEKDKKLAAYDLTKAFVFLYEEKRDNELVPDVLLKTKSGEKIYIEIAVTHQSSNDKIDSGVRIIEFLLNQEEDLKVFKQTKISIFEDNIEMFNFNPTPIYKKLPKECENETYYFTVMPNGKCRILTVPLYKFDQIKENSQIYIKKIPFKSSYTFIEEAEKAFLEGIKIRNCFLCRYHAISNSFTLYEETKPIFCKFYKSNKNSNAAANCEIYRPDKNVFRNTSS